MLDNSSTKDMQNIIDSCGQPMAVLDRKLNVSHANSAMAAVLGMATEKLSGHSFAELWGNLTGADEDEFPPALARGTLPQSLTWFDGRAFAWQAWQPEPDSAGRYLISGQDITAHLQAHKASHRLETKLDQERRLESLKVVAGIIAHDFNNLLLGILGHTDLALSALPVDSSLQNNIEQIQICAQRATDLTERMLAYSDRNNLMMAPIELSNELNKLQPILENYIAEHENIKLEMAVSEAMPMIQADQKHLRLLVMNLLANAVEAIGSKAGEVMISTGTVYADREYLSESYLDQSVPEGNYVYLEVQDNGPGMSENMRRLLFDPFFATNFISAGVGLPAVMGTIREHGGTVKVKTDQGQGTVLRVLFPGLDLMQENLGAEAEQADESAQTPGKLVLVVDDEASVLQVTRLLLERAGFSVLTAASGREAIDLLKEHGEKIGVILLDMLMPHMDGLKTFQELQRLRANLKVLLCSGYPREEVMARFEGRNIAGFIQKPYRAATLFSQIRELLEIESN